jgi:hypothetical protein
MRPSKKWTSGWERVPPVVVLLLAVGWTFGAFSWIVMAFDGGTDEWARWLRAASSLAGGLLAAYFWALYARVHRPRPRRSLGSRLG